MSNFYTANDYAGLTAGVFSFYFGYEETKNDEWAFVVKKKDVELMRLSQPQLGTKSDDTQECLLAGIGKFLEASFPS